MNLFVYLQGAKLNSANLQGANLQRAYLREVDLRDSVSFLIQVVFIPQECYRWLGTKYMTMSICSFLLLFVDPNMIASFCIIAEISHLSF